MEMEERENGKAVATRAKEKTDRVRTEEERGGAASERSRTAQKTKVCSTQIYTTIWKLANQAKGYHFSSRQPKVY